MAHTDANERMLCPHLDLPGPPAKVASRLVIVGGGFAGAALAYHVLRRSSRLQVSLVEPAAEPGRGVAYGTRDPRLQLNAPASRMSLDPEEPLDFVQFAGAQSTPHAFLSRTLYGAYVRDRLARAASAAPGRLRVVRAAAVRVRGQASARAVQLEDGRLLEAERVVLATGLSAHAGALPLPRDARVIDAWDAPALATLPRDGALLLLGSGLSALDVLRSLEGHRGRIVMLSRHGLLPRPHAERPGSFDLAADKWPAPSRLPALIRWLRAQIRRGELDGVPWQHVLDALRPRTAALWQQLSAADRRRFLCHVRPFWEVLRHRAPADALARVSEAQARGTLELLRGRLLTCDAEPEALRVRLVGRAGVQREQRFAGIVKCLGPSADVRDASPLMAALIRDGEAQVCPTRLGIVTGELGRVIDAGGRARDDLFALGELCRASRWETTAAPEIVRQAVGLAELLCQA